MEAVLYTDGISQGSPGPAACGFVLEDADGAVLASGGSFLGSSTGHAAEYMALIWGMRNAAFLQVDTLAVRCDSELLARQMMGDFKVRSIGSQPLFQESFRMASQFGGFSIGYAPDRSGAGADAVDLAHRSLGERASIGGFAIDIDGGQSTLFSLDGVHHAADDSGSAAVYDDYLQKGGTYEIVAKRRFALSASCAPISAFGSASVAPWCIEACIRGGMLDQRGRLYGIDDLKADLAVVAESYEGRDLAEEGPFDRIGFTLEHLVRVVFWDLRKRLPEGAGLCEVAVWCSTVGKVVYRPS
jgi:ribonuclease HI